MQKKRLSVKLISLLLTLSFLISAFSVFAFAQDEQITDDTASEMNVVYNRNFSEGWDYDNGILDSFANGNQIGLGYEYRNSAYNYFLKISKQNVNVAYAHIDTTGLLPTAGKTFVEFDIASSLNNAMGQAIRISVQGDVKTLVEYKEDGMYILGTNVGRAEYAMKWNSLSFEIDFDYGKNNDSADDDEYLITAYFNNEELTSKVYSMGFGGFGVTQLRFSFGNIVEANIDSWYAIDNLQIYSGVDTFTAIPAGTYGTAVDLNAAKDYPLASDAAHPDGYLRGEQDLNRVKDDSRLLIVHYNRGFGEGWTLDQASSTASEKYVTLSTNDNNVDIRSEKDALGAINYFMRFRALNKSASGLKITIPECPYDEYIYLELDLKTGVNTDIGGIVKASGSSDFWLLGIEDGQLVISGTPVGYIGSEWTHIAAMIDPLNMTITVYYGDNGCYNTALPLTFDSITIGQSAGGDYDSYGDWYAVDNLQIYSGTDTFAVVDTDDYGLAVDASAPLDFPLEDAEAPDTPVEPEVDTGTTDDSFSKPTAPSGTGNIITGAPELGRVDLGASAVVLYNRHYGEGWSFGIGGGKSSVVIMQLENEMNLDLTYNYYQHYEVANAFEKGAYWTFNTDAAPKTGKLFIEMDLRAHEEANFGGIFEMRKNNDDPSYYLLGFTGGYLTGYKDTKLGVISEEEWVHVAIEFDFDYAKYNPNATSNDVYLISYYYGNDKFASFECKFNGDEFDGFAGIRVGFLKTATASGCTGQFWEMDNLQVYTGTDTFANIPEDNYGVNVNTSIAKDFPIQSGSTSVDDMISESLFMKLNSDYVLTRNTRTPALENAEGVAYGAPIIINDKIWLPLDTILTFLSYPIYITEDEQSFAISTGTSVTYITLGRDTAVVGADKVVLNESLAYITDKNGNEYLAATVDDIALLFPGFHINVDEMNLITFTENEELSRTSLSQSVKLDIMKRFIFEYITADEVYQLAKEKTNNFDHPYLIINQEKFDELAEVYRLGQLNHDGNPLNDVAGVDETLYSYINAVVERATDNYIKFTAGYSTEPGTEKDNVKAFNNGLEYNGLKDACYQYPTQQNPIGLIHPYPDTNGYDASGGRLSALSSYSCAGLDDLGYAYQITGDIRYAKLAYERVSMIADWDHWGAGHFLNAADAAALVSTAYDWCYDAWVELGYDVDKIADAIYYHGALQGYFYTLGQADAHGRKQGIASNYTSADNNWNAVCTSGVASAAFSVLGYTGFSINTKIASDYARSKANDWGGDMMTTVLTEVVSKNYASLVNLGLDIYAPDGSYEEAVSYWAYGANNLFRYSMILESCLGTDLGLMGTWGLEKTCYSIAHMVSSDYEVFAYNDQTLEEEPCDSGCFAYVAQSVNDDGIRLVRKMHIVEGGLTVSIYDSVFYKALDPDAEIDLPLQYHHVAIHGYTVRSSWDKGAIFAGLLGGDNDDGHGHIDAGQWVYYSDGICWIQDLAKDDYNTYNYFSNNNMYRTNPEGHNVMVLATTTSPDSKNNILSSGQLRSSVSPITDVYDNEHGAYTVVNTLPAYGSSNMLASSRGMLLTNDRNTVVIQDEMTPNGNHTLYWFAHYNVKTVKYIPSVITNVEISSNGRTAYLYAQSETGEDTKCLRLRIVSKVMTGITFGIMNAGMKDSDFVLSATQRYGYSESKGYKKEEDRSMWNKLYIKFEDLFSVEVAVVIEVIDRDDPVDTGYKWTPMYQWEPSADTRDKNDDTVTEVIENNRGKANKSDIPGYTDTLNKKYEAGTLFDDLGTYYRAVTAMRYVVDTLGRDAFSSDDYADSILLYDKFLAMYESYYNRVVTTTGHINGIRSALLGIKAKTAPEDTE